MRYEQLTIHSLVLVHGLGGHPLSTWTYERRRSLLGNSANVRIFWPLDLLAPTLSNVRILTYGYDSDPAHVFDSVSRISMYQHASNLLQDLSRDEERLDDVGQHQYPYSATRLMADSLRDRSSGAFTALAVSL